MLSVNSLIQYEDGDKGQRIDRVLYLDPVADTIVVFDICDESGLPVSKPLSEVKLALARSDVNILEEDPFAFLYEREERVEPRHRELRDKAWSVIKDLVVDADNQPRPEIFDRRKRGKLVSSAAEKSGASKVTIYKYLRKYWRGGQKENALRPYYHLCGAPGEERDISVQKLGRPNAISRVTGEPIGILITEEVEKQFRLAVKRLHRNGWPLTKVFQEGVLEQFYVDFYENQGGVIVPKLKLAEECPTFRQFRYWCKGYREENFIEYRKRQLGEREYNLIGRPILGDSTAMALGPGSIFQIDSTIGDIYLVYSFDRSRIIGRPVLYIVSDVFTHMIVGFAVTLEGPSWIGAMLALENTMTDKVAFCAEYGITVTEADWPSRHASRAIMGDRGELELEYATSLVDGLDREVSNTAPFRADWKGTVERDFRTIDDEGVHWVPGAVRGYRKRGGPDYRLDACLNLQEFRQLMIHLILHHNRFHELKNYNRSEAMIKDHVDAYPIDLWNWGIENCVGQLRALDRDIVRWNLLPHGEASVTGEGIKFKGRTYDCKLAHDKGWYAMARASGWFPRDVSYDPRKPEVIYLRGEDGGRLVTCHMVEGEKAFWGKDWYDILELNELELQREPEKRTRHQQAQAELNAARKSLTDPAFEEAKDARQGMSKAAQVRGIRDNRALEVEKEHEDGAWTFADGERDGESGEGNEAQDMGFRYVAAPKKTDLMRDLDRELLE